ncbi:MAG: hypothetical protein HYR96_10685 [Deltaproteobacteria bacterium]|nr:hypothetical protein [Deltaproteobacteria bacterium]MBI3294908.1 hypothetical protein [Deltaproteobacteria bacterium]
MKTVTSRPDGRFYGLNPDFDSLVHRIIEHLDKEKLSELKKDFHTRLRITQAHPEKAELVEDLWDFFYDWCVFDQRNLDTAHGFSQAEKANWEGLKAANMRGIFTVQKIAESSVKLKELYSGKSITIPTTSASEFFGISKGDLVECRILALKTEGKEKDVATLVRRPSYHPVEVHDYIKKKVRQFKKAEDFSTYQTWLWLLVGMYLKHRIYTHMPIDKIYDDNSRI